MTNTFKNAMISTALKSEMCHLHCTPSGDSPSDSPSQCSGKEGSMSDARFCPVPGTLCQAQCWRNSKYSRMMEFYGLDALRDANNAWDVDMEDFVVGSYAHYQATRMQASEYFPSVEDLFRGEVTSRTGLFLPVCYDSKISPQAFGAKDRNMALPCVCGNDYGNETGVFMSEAGFGNWVDKDEHLADLCQRNMDEAKVLPVTDYMVLCELGYHWPVQADVDNQMNPGADQRCGEVGKLVARLEAKMMTPLELNCEICFEERVGQEIMRDQMGKVKKHPGRMTYNFQHGCDYIWQSCEDLKKASP